MASHSRRLYLLSPHVYVCWTDRGAILLDLKRDRYLGLDTDSCNALSGCIEGWPVSDAAAPTSLHGTLEQLVSLNILTTDARSGKIAAPASVEHPTGALIEGYAQVAVKTGPVHMARCLVAVSNARSLLRKLPFEQLIATVRDQAEHLDEKDFDLATARIHVTSFNRMRAYLFTAQDACLFNSLALRNYLDRQRLKSRWVFGVRSQPFAAHCWLQHGGIVLNDTPENVRNYAPIMAI